MEFKNFSLNLECMKCLLRVSSDFRGTKEGLVGTVGPRGPPWSTLSRPVQIRLKLLLLFFCKCFSQFRIAVGYIRIFDHWEI